MVLRSYPYPPSPDILARVSSSTTAFVLITTSEPRFIASTSEQPPHNNPLATKVLACQSLFVLIAFGSVAAIITKWRRYRRVARPPTSSAPRRHTPTTLSRPLPTTRVPPYSSDTRLRPSQAFFYASPPYPAVAHAQTHGRTVRALDTGVGGQRGGTGGDHDGELGDNDVLPPYDGPPKYDESGS